MDKPGEMKLPNWHESLMGVDLLMLHASPVFWGVDVPRGDNSAVIIFPGFLHGDTYLMVMYAWLRRIGYRPYYSGIDLNAECPDLLIRFHLNKLLQRARAETGGKVHLIGHSLGGVIARSLAAQKPSRIASVITLGSPIQGAMLHRSILLDAEAVRRFIQQKHGVKVSPQCYTQQCQCKFMQAQRKGVPASVPQTSIYTRADGVLDWQACRTGDPEIDVEVRGTHAGLAFNPDVYRTIGNRLARRL
jgi:pimeloyl-ACP methyl ester carboxylesterase